MPRVPQIQPNQIEETVTPRVQDTTRPSIEAFGGGNQEVFKATSQLGQQVVKIREDQIDTGLTKSDLAFDRIESMAKAEMRTRKGEKATPEEMDKLVQEVWSKNTSELFKGIEDQEIKQLAESAGMRRLDKLRGTAIEYGAGETYKYQVDTQKMAIESKKGMAATSYASPEDYMDSMNKMRASVIKKADLEGLNAEQTKEEVKKHESNLHLLTVNQMIIDGYDSLAEERYNKHKDNMTPKDQESAGKLVEEATLRGFGQRRADELMAKHSTMTAALEEARTEPDDKKRDELVRRVKDRFADKKRAQDQDTEDLHRRATDFLEKTPDVDAYAQKNPADFARFSLSQRSALRAYVKKKRGAGVESDPVVYQDLLFKATGNAAMRKEFLGTSLVAPEMLNKLSSKHREEFMKMQADLRSGKPDQKLMDSVRTNKEIKDGVLKANGVNVRTKNKEELARINKFHRLVDVHLRAIQEQSGKVPTKEDTERVANEIMFEVTTDRGLFFDDKKRIFELGPDEKGTVLYEEIPESERIEIEDTFRRNNKPFKEKDVLEAYLKYIEGITERGR